MGCRQRAGTLTLNSHKGEVFGISFAADGRTLASVGADGAVRVWDVVSGRERYALTSHKGPARTVALSPDGNVVASGGRDKTVRLQPSTPSTVTANMAEKIAHKAAMKQVLRPLHHPCRKQNSPFSRWVKSGPTGHPDRDRHQQGQRPSVPLPGQKQSDDPVLNGLLFLLMGRVDPGQSVADAVTLPLPPDRPDGTIPLA